MIMIMTTIIILIIYIIILRRLKLNQATQQSRHPIFPCASLKMNLVQN